MKAQKDPKTGKWNIQFRYTDWQGNVKKTTKRGFNTKREAEEYARGMIAKSKADFSMKFSDFVEIYYKDMETRLRESTMHNKHYMIDLKILPYFQNKKMNEIKPSDIRNWQTELISQGYKPTYLKVINNQLSAIFNFAVKYYELPSNPCKKAGSMGKSKAEEMEFWTLDEFNQFLDAVMDKQISYVAFSILYWTGMRLGEMLALTPADINFEENTISINKSLQRIKGKDIITPPKTPKGNRVIGIPETLAADIKDYMNTLYAIEPHDRIFPITKAYMEHEIARGIKASGVRQIHLHCLRHSAASLMCELGFSPLEIAERLGHEKIETTLNTYSHLYPDKQSKISAKLEESYQKSLQLKEKDRGTAKKKKKEEVR